jgi:hypothetical protein
MGRILSKVTAAGAGLAAMLFAAAPALAQLDYEYTYDYGADAGATAVAGGMGIFMIVVWCCAALFGIVNLVVWVMSLIHCIQHAPDDQKTLWLILIILVPFGAWIYFFTKRKQWSGSSPAAPAEMK